MREAAVIIGASQGLGKSLAYVLAENGIDVILSARSKRDLEAIANDLVIRFQIKAISMPVDLEKIGTEEGLQFVNDCFRNFSEINQVYITAGIINEEDYGTQSTKVLKEIMSVNFMGIAFLIEAFSKKLSHKNSNITVISSIAAIRPRSKNIAYAASKIALEYFVGGLQHYYANNVLRLQLYRMGYMDTAMTVGRKLLLPIAKTEKVARYIFHNRNKKFRLKYYPRFWIIVAMMIKLLPWTIFKKLEQ
ncbi:MAG: SDR family NAD(P)-dependent oxidoreductase [Candidatus Daviesbacteria bacterium]|nr:SDR family NAD(P)-dependent oxidoreductase [Candidatus Daviesbacteria bacterium]